MMHEIIITGPIPNPVEPKYRQISYNEPTGYIRAMIDNELITKRTHPHVIDLFSGDAGVARILRDLGWQESDILCVDRHISPTPLLTGVTWKYWDLSELARSLKNSENIPSEIMKLRATFDITIAMTGESVSFLQTGLLVCNYFIRKGGYILTDDPFTSKIV